MLDLIEDKYTCDIRYEPFLEEDQTVLPDMLIIVTEQMKENYLSFP